ncbi:hypothetical protein SNEBB_009823 [Seison nebaliae]|nr:hypothetical protein SNEBB_009823 [Seison nebaliae]
MAEEKIVVEYADEEKKVRGRPCDALRFELKQCLMNTDCVLKKNYLPDECLRNKNLRPLVDDRCFKLANALFECKRSILDMRSRFRGRKGDQ